MYVGDWAGRGARYWPESLAVVDAAKGEKGRFTYRDLDRRANRVARWLCDTVGVGKGDRVGMLALNGVEYLDVFFACGKLGAVLVPFNWRLHPNELVDLMRRTGPKVLFYSEELRDAAEICSRQVADLRGVSALVHLEGTGFPGSAAYPAVLRGWNGETDAGRGDPDEGHSREPGGDRRDGGRSGPAEDTITTENLTEEDIACLLFTGGTTGLPKAAKISYRMIAWNTLNTAIHEISRDDVTITHTPMFHTGGLLVYTLPLLILGGRVVIMRRWDADEMLSLIEREGVTMFFCVPAQYRMLLDSPRFPETDFGSVRFLTSGGAPLPTSFIDAWQRVHDVPFKQGFGMTEFGPGIFSMEPEQAAAKAGSIGRPNYFVDARIVDDAGQPLPPNEVGELVLRGPVLCSGYFGSAEGQEKEGDKGEGEDVQGEDGVQGEGGVQGDGDELMDAAGEPVDADGWFPTGDLAYVDADGFYYIVDRKKDMFISGGENVYPAEIEQVLTRHPAVSHCAVVGVPHEQWGEVGKAFVVPVQGTAPAEAELLTYLKERLASYKVPKTVVFVESLPLSAAGKVLKRELRER